MLVNPSGNTGSCLRCHLLKGRRVSKLISFCLKLRDASSDALGSTWVSTSTADHSCRFPWGSQSRMGQDFPSNVQPSPDDPNHHLTCPEENEWSWAGSSPWWMREGKWDEDGAWWGSSRSISYVIRGLGGVGIVFQPESLFSLLVARNRFHKYPPLPTSQHLWKHHPPPLLPYFQTRFANILPLRLVFLPPLWIVFNGAHIFHLSADPIKTSLRAKAFLGQAKWSIGPDSSLWLMNGGGGNGLPRILSLPHGTSMGSEGSLGLTKHGKIIYSCSGFSYFFFFYYYHFFCSN